MITPDTKNWTWVLQRTCLDCGFDASTCDNAAVADLVRANATEWQRLHDSGVIRAGRPNDQTWSSLEYACHVRDVFSLFDGRIGLMLTEDDPLFANSDQDAEAIEKRYEQQDPATVLDELAMTADAMATRLDGIGGDLWQRSGRRSDGSSFTVSTIARYMIHDPIHHVWDVTRGS